MKLHIYTYNQAIEPICKRDPKPPTLTELIAIAGYTMKTYIGKMVKRQLRLDGTILTIDCYSFETLKYLGISACILDITNDDLIKAGFSLTE